MGKKLFKPTKIGAEVKDSAAGRCMARWCREQTYKVVKGENAPATRDGTPTRLCFDCFKRWGEGKKVGDTIYLDSHYAPNLCPPLTEEQKLALARSKMTPEERALLPAPPPAIVVVKKGRKKNGNVVSKKAS